MPTTGRTKEPDVTAEFALLPRYVRIGTLIEAGLLTPRARDHMTIRAEQAAIGEAVLRPRAIEAMKGAVDRHVPPRIEAGVTFEHDVSDPMLITPHPHWVPVQVVHRNGDDVFYRTSERTRVDQTTVARFLEIVRPVQDR